MSQGASRSSITSSASADGFAGHARDGGFLHHGRHRHADAQAGSRAPRFSMKSRSWSACFVAWASHHKSLSMCRTDDAVSLLSPLCPLGHSCAHGSFARLTSQSQTTGSHACGLKHISIARASLPTYPSTSSVRSAKSILTAPITCIRRQGRGSTPHRLSPTMLPDESVPLSRRPASYGIAARAPGCGSTAAQKSK